MEMAMVKLLILTFISVAVLNVFILCEEGISIHLKGNRCDKFNKKFIAKSTCRVRAVNRTTQIMSYEMILHPNVSLDDYRIDITSYRKFGTAYRPSLVKLTENWCAAMSGSYSHYITVMSKSFRKYGNVIKPCPIKGRSYVKDMIIDTSNFPKFAPIGEYRLDYYFYTIINGKREFVKLLQDYWDVKPLGAVQF